MVKNTMFVGDRRRQNLYGMLGVDGLPALDRRRPQGVERAVRHAAGGVAVAMAVWLLVMALIPAVRMSVYSVPAEVGLDAASALAELVAAAAFFMFPTDHTALRLRWVAGGLLAMGLGSLSFGYIRLVADGSADINTSMYLALVTQVVALTFFAVGIIPLRPPVLSRRIVALLGALLLFAASAAVSVVAAYGPRLVQSVDAVRVAHSQQMVLQGLTLWHWMLWAVPLALAAATTVRAARHLRGTRPGSWILMGMVLLTGRQMYLMLWPSSFIPVLTTANVLLLVFAAVTTAGGLLELRYLAGERAARLELEREQSKRLAELNVLKADFTAMVAHELNSPLAAVRGFTDMLATGELDRELQAQVVTSIQNEVATLTNLVSDVGMAASVERDDFAIRARPVPLRDVVSPAAAFARTLPGSHPIRAPMATSNMVWADPDRVGQVLRNLLSNAGKYTPEGTPIELRVCPSDDRIRIEVADTGPGIDSTDLVRIFEKFGRGRDRTGRKVPGVGVGLYLSRRIVQAHGSDLTVQSAVGVGTTFGFELEVVL